jgi:cobalt-zinc-cadmium efflux system membrane fusion protein
MAVIHSRELSEAKAEYLASVQRYQLAQSVYEREHTLWQQTVSSEQEYIQAKIDFAEAEIKKILAEQKLYVFGLNQESIRNLKNDPYSRFMEYRISAPFDGVVIDKHITRGEVVTSDSPVFTIADLDTVWGDFDVFPRDLPYVNKGQSVVIFPDKQTIKAELMFVSPVLNPETRTATARVILDNSEGAFYPGQFVTAQLNGKIHSGGIVIPRKAVQVIDGKKCVFVNIGLRYEPRNVIVGRSSNGRIEIISGLKKGENVVTDGAFELKSKIITSTLDSHAGHGH